jgi:acetylornithine deacetylase/succinyl-diaminopimelate desuccinylase-like protein
VTDLDATMRAELTEFLAIPSVSANPAHRDDIVRAGEWVCDFVRSAGGTCELVQTKTHPLAVGEIRASTSAETAPTVIIYGHFDVQPPEPLDLWDSPPFEARFEDGWLYARGSCDDKGQLYMQLKAAAELAREGALPVNIRVCCDGEEEIGGQSIVEFLNEDDRGADACVIFDGLMERQGQPSFWTATRGLIGYDLRVRTGERDMHSGLFGNAALNAIHVLMDLLGALRLRNGRLPEPLRAGISPPTAEELESWQKLPSGQEMLDSMGARPIDERAVEEFYLRTFAEPSMDVNGIIGGKPGLLNTTLIVSAEANFTIRLAPGQDRDEIDKVVHRLVEEATPPSAEVELTLSSSSQPGIISPDDPVIQLGLDAFERATGVRPLLARAGGTLPIIPALTDNGIPTVLTGFAVPESNAHSPNECIPVDYIPLGIKAAKELYTAFGALA